MKLLEGQTALVTGGSRGIGAAIARTLAENGANVVITYRSGEEAANKVKADCEVAGVACLAVKADASNAAEWEALVKEAMSLTGRLEILVNNAGITRDNLMMRMSEEDFEAVLQTNLFGAFYGMKAVCRPMMKQKYGRIINMSSVVGLHGNAGQTNYAAAKAGVVGMTKSLAKELASRHITVNAVAPGFIETDMTAVMTEAAKEATLASIPMKAMGKAEDIAEAVLFLASPKSSYLTGQVISVDGGMTI